MTFKLQLGEFFGTVARTRTGGAFDIKSIAASALEADVAVHTHDDAHFVLCCRASTSRAPAVRQSSHRRPSCSSIPPARGMYGTGGNKVFVLPDADAVVVVTTTNYRVAHASDLTDSLFGNVIAPALGP